MEKLNATQRIEKAHVSIMGHDATRAYSSILMVGSVSVDDKTKTAYTNGRDCVYGKAFVDRQSDAELIGLVLHENGHKYLQHAFLWKHLWKRNAKLANMSADYVVNLEIDDISKKYPNFVKLPKGALLDEKYRGMDTQEVFNLLYKEDGGDEGERGDEGDESGGLDEHDFDSLSEEEMEELAEEMDQAIRQGALLAGKQGGDVPRSFKDLMQPKVDWREQLREFITAVSAGKDDSTWRRPNRRWLQHDMYLPSTISETMGKMCVVVDTSGSISAELVSRFLSEIVGICDSVTPEQLHLICCDAQVASHDVFDPTTYPELAQIREFRGGGGTDMPEALRYIDKNNIDPVLTLVLTDGYTPWPSTLSHPVLWAITEKNVVSPIGTSIHIDD